MGKENFVEKENLKEVAGGFAKDLICPFCGGTSFSLIKEDELAKEFAFAGENEFAKEDKQGFRCSKCGRVI